MKLLSIGLALVFLVAGTGCSTLRSINPFASPEFLPVKLETFAATLQPRQLWKSRLKSSKSGYFQPAIHDGVLYAAAADGTVAAFSLSDGRALWRVELKTNLAAGVTAGPAGLVVVAEKGELIVLDTHGALRWRVAVGSQVYTQPAWGDNLLLVKTGDSRLLALDADSGARRWVYARPAPALTLRAAEPVVIRDGLVIAGFSGGKMVALTLATGALRWEATVANPKGATEIERIADVSGAPLLSGREVCVTTFQGRLGCFDVVTGNALWTRPFSSPVGLAGDDRLLVAPDEKGLVAAFAQDSGTSIWKVAVFERRQPSLPVLTSRSVITGDFEGYLHWLSREDGRMQARLRPDDTPLAGSMVLHNGRLYGQTRGGAIFAIEVDET
ncbi:MAG: outer membrane protein assembly factor BamB [Burkholderiaceae bacterium]